MSCLTTSPTRRSRIVPAAVLIASAAASSHDVLLVPMTSVTLYTLITLSFRGPPTRAPTGPVAHIRPGAWPRSGRALQSPGLSLALYSGDVQDRCAAQPSRRRSAQIRASAPKRYIGLTTWRRIHRGDPVIRRGARGGYRAAPASLARKLAAGPIPAGGFARRRGSGWCVLRAEPDHGRCQGAGRCQVSCHPGAAAAAARGSAAPARRRPPRTPKSPTPR